MKLTLNRFLEAYQNAPFPLPWYRILCGWTLISRLKRLMLHDFEPEESEHLAFLERMAEHFSKN
ncbi:MAG: hypothetical protein D6684_07145 [Deinococcus-Thermus bacterium]|nr:MAG: hypothetical protein D6684_07145 [Deinococcota bacterium]